MPSPKREQRPQGNLFSVENILIFLTFFLATIVFSSYVHADSRYSRKDVQAAIAKLESSIDQLATFDAVSEVIKFRYEETAQALSNRLIKELKKPKPDKKIALALVSAYRTIGGENDRFALVKRLESEILAHTKNESFRSFIGDLIQRTDPMKEKLFTLDSLEDLRSNARIETVDFLFQPPPLDNEKDLIEYLQRLSRAILTGEPSEAIRATQLISKSRTIQVVRVLATKLSEEIYNYVGDPMKKKFDIFPPGEKIPEANWENVVVTGNLPQALVNGLYEMGAYSAGNYAKSSAIFALGKAVNTDFGDESRAEEVNHKLEIVFSTFNKFKDRDVVSLGHEADLELDANRLVNLVVQKKESAAEVGKRVEAYMKERVVGQEKIVSELKSMEMFASLYHEAVPDQLLIMNANNNGINHIIRTYVDAINNKEGASDSALFTIDPVHSWTIGTYLGAATGVAGSSHLPVFFHWLVSVSGGRYRIEVGEREEYIVENPSWRPGDQFKNTLSPTKAVAHFRNFQDWAAVSKSEFYSMFREGKFKIKSPNGGLGEIEVPVRLIITTTEGGDLVVPVNPLTGERDGRASTFAEMEERYNLYWNNEQRLREKLLETNSIQNSADAERRRGINPDTMRKIKKIVLAKPMSEVELRAVTVKIIEEFNNLRMKKLGQGGFHLTYDDAFIDFIHKFELVPEAQAGQIEQKIQELVVTPILSLIEREQLVESREIQSLGLRFQVNPDRTANLIVTKKDSGEEIAVPLTATEREKARQPISDSEIDRLLNLDKEASKYVVNAEDLLAKIREQIVAMRDGRGPHLTPETAALSASSIMLLGLTSTGKTQIPKALAKALYGSEKEFVNISFGDVTTDHDIDRLIFGFYDGRRAIESEFVKAHRRTNGMMVVNLDELANIKSPRLLYRIYDLLREPTVKGFIRPDGSTQSLVMSNIIFIITGNATQEFWAQIPNHLPVDVQMLAYEEVDKNLKAHPSLVTNAVSKVFPPALLARVKSINVVSPHNYASIRALTHMKLQNGVKEMESGEGRRAWKISYPNEAEYIRLVETIESEGFQITKQGASIDSYVEQLFTKLKNALYPHKIPSGQTVSLSYLGEREIEGEEVRGERPKLQMFQAEVVSDGRKIEFSIPKTIRDPKLKEHPDVRPLTGAHEAGHLIANYILEGNKNRMTRVSIIPGVTLDGVAFEGVQESERVESKKWKREDFIREMAVDLAGKVAQSMASSDGAHDGGKRNDLQNATELAEKGILLYGVSEAWGLKSYGEDLTLAQIKAMLSEKELDLLNQERNAMILEADTRARILLENNLELLIRLANRVTELGDMKKLDIDRFFDENKNLVNKSLQLKPTQMLRFATQDLYRKTEDWARKTFRFYKVQEQDSLYRFPRPTKVADIEEFARNRKKEQIEKVPLPANLPLLSRSMGPLNVLSSPSNAPDLMQAAQSTTKPECKDVL